MREQISKSTLQPNESRFQILPKVNVQARASFISSQSDFHSRPVLNAKLKKAYHFAHRIGEQSVSDFFSNYKDINKSVQRDEHLKEAQTAFLVECNK
jgi:hypothetical protein